MGAPLTIAALSLGCIETHALTEAEAEYVDLVWRRTHALVGCVEALAEQQDEDTLFGPSDDGLSGFRTAVEVAVADLDQLHADNRIHSFPDGGAVERQGLQGDQSGVPFIAINEDLLSNRTLGVEVLIHEAAHVSGNDHSRAMKRAIKSFADEDNTAYTAEYVREVIDNHDFVILADLQFLAFQHLLGQPDRRAWRVIDELAESNEPGGVLAVAQYQLTTWTEEDWVRARIENDPTDGELDYQLTLGADVEAIVEASLDPRCEVFEQVQLEFNTALAQYASENDLDYTESR